MFYCADCAKKKGWEVSLFQSFGICEICGKKSRCNDIPSYLLPVTDKRHEWIEEVWPSCHDNLHDEQLLSYINNYQELDRLNRWRREHTEMYLFNMMIVKALYVRNKHLLGPLND